MPTWDVQVSGSSVDALMEVKTEAEDESAIGKAKALIGNTSSNRGISSGESATVLKNGSTEFEGKVISDPRVGDNNEGLELVVADDRYELQKITVNRPFYRMDTGAILREAINEEINPLSRRFIDKMESTTDWSSDAEEFTTTSFDTDKHREYGSDMLFLGWRKGASGDYHATYSAVPSGAIPGDGQIQELVTRFLVNDEGDKFDVEVGLQDNSGNLYVWDFDRVDGFDEYSLRAEEATPGGDLIVDGDLSNGELRYAISISGSLSEPRAVILDGAMTKPFTLTSRNPDLDPSGVQDSGRTITRRFDESAFEMLKAFSVEDNATSYVGANQVLNWEPSGERTSSKSIKYSSTPVVDVTIDRDYDDIVNEVTVQGAGDIQVTVRADSSIDFYGISSRQQPLTNKDLQTEEEAEDFGRGYLEENAWDDTALEFTIADTTYSGIRVGELVPVEWDPPNGDSVIGDFVVSSTKQDDAGYPTLKMTGHYE